MYNCIYSVLFLFFIYFCDFVYDMVEVFNDLSFDFDININIYSYGLLVRNIRVLVVKIMVGFMNGIEDDCVLCIIYKINYILDECCVFCYKLFEECKIFLK